MVADTLLKYIVDVQNSEKMTQLVDELKRGKEAIAALNAQLQAGTMSQQQFLAHATPIARTMQQTTSEMNKLKVASGDAGRGLQQLGYAVDDIQYGFSAIVNNIPQIVLGLGGSAGVAGAVAVAAVAINQLWKHMGDLQDIFQSNWSGGTVEQLHDIRIKAEEATEAFKKLAETPTKMEAAEGKGVKEFVTEQFRPLFQGLSEAIGQHPGMRAIPRRPHAARGGGAPGVIPEPELTAQQAGEEALEANRKKAAELMVEALKPGQAGETARQKIQALAAQFPTAFPKGSLEAFSPEAAEEKRIKEENIRADVQGRKNIREWDKKHADEQERLNKILTKTGKEYEHRDKVEALHEEKEDLEKELAKGKRGLNAKQQQLLEDEIIGAKRPQESKVMDTKAYVNATMTGGLSQIPHQQLGHLKSMDDRIKEIAKEIKNYGKLQ